MALQFVTGSSISGSNEYVYQTICRQAKERPKVSYLFLVPEQATLQVQRELAAVHEDHVLGNIDVLSFGRLAHRVLEEQQKKENIFLNDTGKAMLLRKAASGRAQELELFGRNLGQNGFILELKSVISEFSAYRVTDEMLEKLTGSLDNRPALQKKLRDIRRVYQAFRQELGEAYLTAEELLTVLAQLVPGSGWLKNCVVLLTGFTGFTPLQYLVLEQLLVCCRHMVCVLTTDAAGERETLFSMSTQLKAQLRSLAKQHGIAVDERVHPCPARNDVSRELQHLERQLYRSPVQPWQEAPQGIHILRAQNPREELTFVLRRVMELIRSGYCYRDLAIAAGDPERYSSEAAQLFTRAGIPFFIDQKKPVKGNPLIRLVKQALAVVSEHMSYDSVMAFLRNPLISAEPEQYDVLDNYLLAAGIDHTGRWKHPWAMPYAQADEQMLTELNVLREQIYGWFTPLREAWEQKQADTRTRMTALFSFLQQFSPEARLQCMQETFRQEGAYDLESEYAQVYPKLLDLFDQIVGLMGEEQLEPELLADILDSGFEELQVGFLPAAVDRLVIGDLMRTRMEHIKVLFVVGANDKVLPKAKERGGILTDYDRELLREQGLELALPAREEIFRQQYYLYLLLTRPSGQLYLTFSEQTSDAKPLRPAHILSQVQKIFPLCAVEKAAEQYTGLDALTTREEGFSQLTAGLRRSLDGEDCGWWLPLYRYYAGEADYRDALERLRDGLFYGCRTEKIDAAIARRLYGETKEVSISRLEKYASCAYAHFLTYGMGLKERKQFELQSADYGSLFHAAVSHFFSLIEKRGLDWRSLDSTQRSGLVEESVEKAIEEYRTTVFDSSQRNRSMAGRIRRMTDRTVWALQYQWNQGKYEKIWHETDFGRQTDTRVLLSPQPDLQISLMGRIDRVDLAQKEGNLYVKVIDYKSGYGKLDLTKIYHGLQLQLVLYLEAAMSLAEKRYPSLNCVPGGMFYYNMKDPMVDGMGLTEKEIEAKLQKELRMNGLMSAEASALRLIDETGGQVVTGLEYKKDGSLSSRALAGTREQLNGLRRFAKRKALQLSRELYDGRIEVNPYLCAGQTACDYCPYHSICGFDLQAEGFHYRQLGKMDRETMWSAVDMDEQSRE